MAEITSAQRFTHDVCTRCHLVIAKGEEVHPTARPFHVPCREHDQCYVLCIDQHPEYITWYISRFERAPIQRIQRAPGWYGKYPFEEYVPCPECHYIDPGLFSDGFGVPVRLGGTSHPQNCPTIPKLSPEAEERLRRDLEEMDRCRRRAEVESRNYFIG